MSRLNEPGRKIHIGIILLNSETEILDVAPIDLLNGISKAWAEDMPFFTDVMKAHSVDTTFHWVNETGASARLTSGITLMATDSFETCPPLDIVLMGAAGVSYTATETELAFIRKAHDDCSAFLSICGRCVHPLAAGSLEGKTATAPRPMVEMLRQSAPGVKWVERRWTHDGKMWTSGALLNGLDLMVAFVREVFGERAGLVTSAIEIGAWPCRGAEY